MSRIHDALKKAEEERNETHPPAAGPTLPAVAPGTVVVEENRTPSMLTDNVPPPTSSVRLGFDAIMANCARPEWHPQPYGNVFLDPEATAHGAEQFRTLRSRLYQLRGSQPTYTLLVTSAVPDEGKTFIVSNLAHAIVQQANRRALIIDADLRYPQLHLAMGAPLAPGLTEYLRGEADEKAIIQRGNGGNLCFIPGGTQVTNPSEVLSSGRLKVLLDRLAPVFDWVILDSPPCLPVEDSSMVAGLCNGVLLVLRAGSTPAEAAQKACQNLNGKNIVGVVLNAMEESQLYGSYYYPHKYGKNCAQGPKG